MVPFLLMQLFLTFITTSLFRAKSVPAVCGHGFCQVICARESRPLALPWEMESGAAMLKQCSLGNRPG